MWLDRQRTALMLQDVRGAALAAASPLNTSSACRTCSTLRNGIAAGEPKPTNGRGGQPWMLGSGGGRAAARSQVMIAVASAGGVPHGPDQPAAPSCIPRGPTWRGRIAGLYSSAQLHIPHSQASGLRPLGTLFWRAICRHSAIGRAERRLTLIRSFHRPPSVRPRTLRPRGAAVPWLPQPWTLTAFPTSRQHPKRTEGGATSSLG